MFSGLHFYTLSKTLTACRDSRSDFLKVKTLLKNAFKLCTKELDIDLQSGYLEGGGGGGGGCMGIRSKASIYMSQPINNLDQMK